MYFVQICHFPCRSQIVVSSSSSCFFCWASINGVCSGGRGTRSGRCGRRGGGGGGERGPGSGYWRTRQGSVGRSMVYKNTQPNLRESNCFRRWNLACEITSSPLRSCWPAPSSGRRPSPGWRRRRSGARSRSPETRSFFP